MSRILTALLVLPVVLGACASPAPLSGYGISELTAALQESGGKVRDVGSIEQEFFTPSGRRLAIGDQELQVFQYEDDAARQAESSLIQADGSPNPTTMVMWIDQPHFWAKGRLIVLYLGSDAETLGHLNGALGQPLTQTDPVD